jgi:TRAP-type C4-dicarboxylate transport system substrate-binding protein
MSKPRKIRWLIAHQPQELFFRTARAFSDALKKYSNDEFEIEMLTYDDYVEKYHEIPGLEEMKHSPDNDVTFEEVGMKAFWGALFDSEVEMSQIQIFRVGDHHYDFRALDLPFLFDDHDHVQRVVEGPVGQKLCRELGEKSGVTGLAFTYSGGFRVIGSPEPICTLEDLLHKTVAVGNQWSLGETLDSMGGKYMPTPIGLWWKQDPMLTGQADAVETTYLRFDDLSGKHILKSNPSMFMTTIVVSNKFWATLTADQQEGFRKAALAASRKEREWSVEDSATYEATAQERGITITDMSEEDRAELKRQSQKTYFKFKYAFSDGLIKEIRAQK